AGANFGARITYPAGLCDRLFRRPAIERHGQDARHGSFPNAPVPTEDVAVRCPPLLNGIFQGACDMLLPDDLREPLRTILACQDLITHVRKLLYRAGECSLEDCEERH